MKCTGKLATFLLGTYLFLAACTTIGTGTPPKREYTDYEKEKLRICIYKDSTVSDKRAGKITGVIKEKMAYNGVDVEIPWMREWQRPAFRMKGIIKDIVDRPLEYPCDRLLGVVGRDYKDFIWGLLMPEVLGAIEDYTLTKGYTVGKWGSLNQVLSLKSPTNLAVHETYHLLGCKHGLSARSCYKQVEKMRGLAKQNRKRGEDFFPATNFQGEIFWTREEAEDFLREQLEKLYKKGE